MSFLDDAREKYKRQLATKNTQQKQAINAAIKSFKGDLIKTEDELRKRIADEMTKEFVREGKIESMSFCWNLAFDTKDIPDDQFFVILSHMEYVLKHTWESMADELGITEHLKPYRLVERQSFSLLTERTPVNLIRRSEVQPPYEIKCESHATYGYDGLTTITLFNAVLYCRFTPPLT